MPRHQVAQGRRRAGHSDGVPACPTELWAHTTPLWALVGGRLSSSFKNQCMVKFSEVSACSTPTRVFPHLFNGSPTFFSVAGLEVVCAELRRVTEAAVRNFNDLIGYPVKLYYLHGTVLSWERKDCIAIWQKHQTGLIRLKRF